MAISIFHNPGTYNSVNGDLIFTVCDIVKASDPVLYPDYRYVADVYVGATMIARLKAYPQPDNKMGVFNVANIVRNYIAATFNPTAASLRAQELGTGEFYITVTVKFGEEYNFTLYTNITVDSARTYFGHYNGRLIGATTNLSGKVDKPMTDRPTYTLISPITAGTPVYTANKNNFVPFLPSSTAPIQLVISSYTADGTLVATNSQSISPTAGDIQQLYNLSPTVINTVFPGLIPLTVASYYTIKFLSSEILLDRIIRFNLVCESRFEVFTLHFLNRFGGMESRDFTKVSRKVIDVDKNEFGKLGYTMDTSGVVSYANANRVYNETRTVYSSQYKEKMTLNTDILTDVEYLWLADLILSPMVYLEVPDPALVGASYFVPCVIVSNNYEFRKVVNDKLTNLTVSIEFGETFNAQFR